MEVVPLSFREWCYPTKHKRRICCAWGNCGYIAISHKNIITIYKYDGNQFTIYLSWSPFDTAEVTALGWFDGSCAPCESLPIIAASFTNGTTIIFDLDTNSVLSKFKHNNQTVKVIKWSPYNPNEFYFGTEDGQFSICEMSNENEKISITIKDKFSVDFPIDFISIDKLSGSTIVLCSKEGKLAYINDIYQMKNARYNPQPGSNNVSNFLTKRLLNFNDHSIINSIEFIPGQFQFLLISTSKASYIHLLSDGISLPFISALNIEYIYPCISKNNFFVVFKDSIELWSYKYDNLDTIGDLKKLSSLNIQAAGQPDIDCFSFLNDNLVVFTKSAWLTIIEEVKSKLFVTRRNKMMPPKPIDWDFKGSQIALLTSDGQIVLTEKVDDINFLRDMPGKDSLKFFIPPPPVPEPAETPASASNDHVSTEKVPSFFGSSENRTAFDPSAIKMPDSSNMNRRRAQSFQVDQTKSKVSDAEFSTAAVESTDTKKKARKDSSVAKEAPKKGGGFFGLFRKNKDKAKPKPRKKSDDFEPEGDTLFDLDEEHGGSQPAQPTTDNDDNEIDSDDEALDTFDQDLSSHKGKAVNHSTSNSSLNSAAAASNATNAPGNIDEIEFFCSHSPTQKIKKGELIQPKADAKVGCSLSFSCAFTTDPTRFHFDDEIYFSHIFNTASLSSVTATTTLEANDETGDENKDSKKNEQNTVTLGSVNVSTSANDYMNDPDWKLNVQHLKWISKNKIIAWGTREGKNSMVLINIKNKKVSFLMKSQLDGTKRPITDVKFSKDMKVAFISFGDRFIAFFRLRKPFQWIGAIKFSKESIGDFSPDFLRTDFFDNVNAIDDDEDDEEDNEKETETQSIDFGTGTKRDKKEQIKMDMKKVYLAAFLSESLNITIVKINKSIKAPIKIVFERAMKIPKATPSSFLWRGPAIKKGLYNNAASDENNKFPMLFGSKEGRLFKIDFTDTFNIVRPDDKNVNESDIVVKQLAAVGGGSITSISPLLFPDRNKNSEKSRESVVTSFEDLKELSEPEQEEEDEKESKKKTKNQENEQKEVSFNNFFVVTNSGQSFLIKNGKQYEMKNKVKNVKFATDLTMLTRFSHSGSLSRVEFNTSPRSVFIKSSSKLLNAFDKKVNFDLVISDGSYSLPPVQFKQHPNFISEVKKQKSISDMIRVCRLHGQNYIASALVLIADTHNNLEFLSDYWFLKHCNKENIYSNQLFKSALFASKLDMSHQLLMNTNPDDPMFILNMTRASFFDMPVLLEKARNQLLEANEEFERMKNKNKEIKAKKNKKFIKVTKNKEVTKVDENGNETTETVTVEEEEEVNEPEENDSENKTIDQVLEIDSVIIEKVKNSKETFELFGNKMELALNTLIKNKRFDDAVETLLIIGQVYRAVDLLLEMKNVREAALLSSMWPLAPFTLLKLDSEEEDEEVNMENSPKKLMMKVAEEFCKQGGFLLALSLLTGAGMNKEAIEMVTKNIEDFPKIIKGIHIVNMDNFDEGAVEDSDEDNDWV